MAGSDGSLVQESLLTTWSPEMLGWWDKEESGTRKDLRQSGTNDPQCRQLGFCCSPARTLMGVEWSLALPLWGPAEALT